MHLSEQSQTIGQIITTVEDLSAQSNLLSVNRCIERPRQANTERVRCGRPGGQEPGEQSRRPPTVCVSFSEISRRLPRRRDDHRARQQGVEAGGTD